MDKPARTKQGNPWCRRLAIVCLVGLGFFCQLGNHAYFATGDCTPSWARLLPGPQSSWNRYPSMKMDLIGTSLVLFSSLLFPLVAYLICSQIVALGMTTASCILSSRVRRRE